MNPQLLSASAVEPPPNHQTLVPSTPVEQLGWCTKGGWHVELTAGEATFIRPDGRPLVPAPASSSGGGLTMNSGVSARSLRCWDGTRFNVGYAIDVLWSQYRETIS